MTVTVIITIISLYQCTFLPEYIPRYLNRYYENRVGCSTKFGNTYNTEFKQLPVLCRTFSDL